MQQFQRTEFGDYLLHDRIGAGGMAEIFLATAQGIEGFEKRLVIKRILPTFSGDSQFVRMFIEEAKLCVALRHPNIVQVYDLGEIDGQYYIAMEYVDGRDLLKTLAACGKKRIGFPTDIALYIVMEVLKGLDYAHGLRRPDGEPLGIIHRDVSPSNVLLSFEGEVKIADFGIAKASTREKTETGILKGKFGYMAPEQVTGAPIDHRADIFAVGIVLYELLTGHRLFAGKNDLAVLERVRDANIEPPPRFYRPDLAPELEQIVIQALSREPRSRFQRASDLHDALYDYTFRSHALIGPPQLARFMQALFLTDPEEIERRLRVFLPLPALPSDLQAAMPGEEATQNNGHARSLIAPARQSTAGGRLAPPSEADERTPLLALVLSSENEGDGDSHISVLASQVVYIAPDEEWERQSPAAQVSGLEMSDSGRTPLLGFFSGTGPAWEPDAPRRESPRARDGKANGRRRHRDAPAGSTVWGRSPIHLEEDSDLLDEDSDTTSSNPQAGEAYGDVGVDASDRTNEVRAFRGREPDEATSDHRGPHDERDDEGDLSDLSDLSDLEEGEEGEEGEERAPSAPGRDAVSLHEQMDRAASAFDTDVRDSASRTESSVTDAGRSISARSFNPSEIVERTRSSPTGLHGHVAERPNEASTRASPQDEVEPTVRISSDPSVDVRTPSASAPPISDASVPGGMGGGRIRTPRGRLRGQQRSSAARVPSGVSREVEAVLDEVWTRDDVRIHDTDDDGLPGDLAEDDDDGSAGVWASDEHAPEDVAAKRMGGQPGSTAPPARSARTDGASGPYPVESAAEGARHRSGPEAAVDASKLETRCDRVVEDEDDEEGDDAGQGEVSTSQISRRVLSQSTARVPSVGDASGYDTVEPDEELEDEPTVDPTSQIPFDPTRPVSSGDGFQDTPSGQSHFYDSEVSIAVATPLGSSSADGQVDLTSDDPTYEAGDGRPGIDADRPPASSARRRPGAPARRIGNSSGSAENPWPTGLRGPSKGAPASKARPGASAPRKRAGGSLSVVNPRSSGPVAAAEPERTPAGLLLDQDTRQSPQVSALGAGARGPARSGRPAQGGSPGFQVGGSAAEPQHGGTGADSKARPPLGPGPGTPKRSSKARPTPVPAPASPEATSPAAVPPSPTVASAPNGEPADAGLARSGRAHGSVDPRLDALAGELESNAVLQDELDDSSAENQTDLHDAALRRESRRRFTSAGVALFGEGAAGAGAGAGGAIPAITGPGRLQDAGASGLFGALQLIEEDPLSLEHSDEPDSMEEISLPTDSSRGRSIAGARARALSPDRAIIAPSVQMELQQIEARERGPREERVDAPQPRPPERTETAPVASPQESTGELSPGPADTPRPGARPKNEIREESTPAIADDQVMEVSQLVARHAESAAEAPATDAPPRASAGVEISFELLRDSGTGPTVDPSDRQPGIPDATPASAPRPAGAPGSDKAARPLQDSSKVGENAQKPRQELRAELRPPVDDLELPAPRASARPPLSPPRPPPIVLDSEPAPESSPGASVPTPPGASVPTPPGAVLTPPPRIRADNSSMPTPRAPEPNRPARAKAASPQRPVPLPADMLPGPVVFGVPGAGGGIPSVAPPVRPAGVTRLLMAVILLLILVIAVLVVLRLRQPERVAISPHTSPAGPAQVQTSPAPRGQKAARKTGTATGAAAAHDPGKRAAAAEGAGDKGVGPRSDTSAGPGNPADKDAASVPARAANAGTKPAGERRDAAPSDERPKAEGGKEGGHAEGRSNDPHGERKEAHGGSAKAAKHGRKKTSRSTRAHGTDLSRQPEEESAAPAESGGEEQSAGDKGGGDPGADKGSERGGDKGSERGGDKVGTIEIACEQPSTVRIDGSGEQYKVESSRSIKLKTGTHHVTVRRPGAPHLDYFVNVVEGQAVRGRCE